MPRKHSKANVAIAQDGSPESEKDRGRRPWLKFYVADWLGDQALARCSLAAQGLWIRLCAAMHHQPGAAPYGHFEAAREDEALDLGRMCGCGEEEAARLLAELERRKVFSRDDLGRIYSRRMVRDESLRITRATAGACGAASTNGRWPEDPDGEILPRQNVSTTPGNTPGTSRARAGAMLEARDQRLETRDQKAEPEGGAAAPIRKRRPPSNETWETVLARPDYGPLRTCLIWTAAWGRWIQYKHERRHGAPPPITAAAIFNKALAMGAEAHAAAIDHSIANSYTGIYPEKASNAPGGRSNMAWIQEAMDKHGTS